MTWYQSSAYCQLLEGLVDHWDPAQYRFQLPTEAQWEYSCRAGTTTAFYDGSDCTVPEGQDPALDRLGWFGKNSGGTTHPVKEKNVPNAWGLYDLHGNVWEWCADVWVREAYQSRTEGTEDPFENNNDEGARRVVRGGSWRDSARLCRSAYRFGPRPGFGWLDGYGLRLSAGPERVWGAERRVP